MSSVGAAETISKIAPQKSGSLRTVFCGRYVVISPGFAIRKAIAASSQARRENPIPKFAPAIENGMKRARATNPN